MVVGSEAGGVSGDCPRKHNVKCGMVPESVF
jgi:hypothetical protein